MSSSYLPYRPDEALLLPPSLGEWLPSDHLSHFISETVDQLDLRRFHGSYNLTRRGNQPFHPSMMVKVLLYAYSTGRFSSRQIARSLHEDVAFRSLAAGNYPAHRTISDFRQRHLSSLESLFVQVVGIARECGLLKLGTVAIDGTKIKANASRHKAMSYGRMLEAEKALENQIADLLAKAQATDLSEADQEDSPTSLPCELAGRQERLKRIQDAKKRLEARQQEIDKSKGRTPNDERKPRDKDGRPKGGKYKRDFGVPESSAQESFTDPDSRIMPHRGGGFEQSYNCQAGVDRDSHLIVAISTGNSPSDAGQLATMALCVKEVCKENPRLILADAGYRSEEGFRKLEEMGVPALVALGREGKSREDETNPVKSDQGKEKGHPCTDAMRERLRSQQGQDGYRQRKWIVEPVFGWIKNILGFRQVSMRGIGKVRAEWALVCTVMNLRRMHRLSMA
jgi:transposase/IS5 family transposase